MDRNDNCLESTVFDRTLTCELNDEIVLPDYMPPISRVISADATAAPPSRYVSGSEAEFAGNVRYRLLYESAPDKENNTPGGLWCAESTSEYDVSVKRDDNGSSDFGDYSSSPSDFVTVASANTENVSARVTAPRRVTLKCRVRVRAKMYGKKEYAMTCRGSAPENSIRRLSGSGFTPVTLSGISDPIELQDNLTPDMLPAGKGEIRVITCGGNLFISDVNDTGTSANCRGDAELKLLLCREGEGERPFAVTRRIPFSTEILYDTSAGEGLKTDGARCWGAVTQTSASVEDGNVICSATIMICAEAAGTGEFGCVRDVYSCEVNSETARKKLPSCRPVGIFNGNATVSGSEELKKVVSDPGVRIVSAEAVPMPDPVFSAEIGTNCSVSLAGKLKCTVITDNGAEMSSGEFEIPYKYTADLPELRGAKDADVTGNAEVGAVSCKCRIDGDRITADCEIWVAMRVNAESEINAVSEVNFGTPRKDPIHGGGRNRGITVCYPGPDDTLWSVAKRYGADTDKVAAENGLTPSPDPDTVASLTGTDFLII